MKTPQKEIPYAAGRAAPGDGTRTCSRSIGYDLSSQCACSQILAEESARGAGIPACCVEPPRDGVLVTNHQVECARPVLASDALHDAHCRTAPAVATRVGHEEELGEKGVAAIPFQIEAPGQHEVAD